MRPHQLGGAAALAIDITDTGAGMDRETVQRVFEPFFTTKPVGEGTGLGLSQIHGFAAQAGGVAEIISQLGSGTTLRLILPKVDKFPVRAGPVSEREPIPPGMTVLLVEDNEQVRHFAAQLLKDLGTTVRSAANAADALRVLQEDHFDLVFTDVVMPGMSGIDLARQFKIRAPDMPVLLATGYSEQMIGEGAAPFDVLSKPYGPDTLSAAIRKLLSTRGASHAGD
ncbi:response regulator [Sphingobium estronivorans]|uniref:response regulator n=1 Tax=Sphingobium estronivorans TaxID=1577690 RepID=UPI0013C2AFAC|nr:response regulator [Sphingobium estronivorans]